MKKPPPIPKSLWSSLGPIRVKVVRAIKAPSDGTEIDDGDFGVYDPQQRVIQIKAGLERWARWQALQHEWAHSVLMDAGLHNVFTDEQQEVIADAFGTALVGAMRHNLEEPHEARASGRPASRLPAILAPDPTGEEPAGTGRKRDIPASG